VEEHTSFYEGQASEIVFNTNLDDFCAIICVGGDGTVHEIINGLMSRSDKRILPIGHIPVGTGNALATNLYGTATLEEACKKILDHNIRCSDLCKVTVEGESPVYSFLSQSFGMLSEVDVGTDKWRWMGDYRFTLGMLREIFRMSTYYCDIFYEKENGKWDTTSTDRVSLVMGAKMPFISSSALLFPDCALDDGFISLVVVDGDISRKDLFNAFLQIEHGQQVNHPSIHYYKTRKFALVPRTQGVLSVDGENLGMAKPFWVKVVPRGIQFV
jgi:sphingosine kinase